MALTEEQKLEIKAKYGIGTPTPVSNPREDRLNRIKSIIASTDTEQETGIVADIKGIGSGIKEDLMKRGENVAKVSEAEQKGEQGFLRSAFQKVGQVAGGVSDVIGQTVMGGLKALTPQPVQEAVGETVQAGAEKLMETDTAQKLATWYSTLDEKTKRDIGSVAGIASLATDITGAGLVKKPVVAGVKKGIDVATDVAKAGIKPVVKAGKEVVESAVKPENIMQRVARINPTEQVKFKDISGETVGEYLTNRKIFGTPEQITEKLVRQFQKSKSEADMALDKLPGTYKPTPIKTVLTELLSKEKSISTPGALSQDFKTVQALVNKFKKDGLTMSEINQVKRLYERNVKLDYLKQNLPEGVKKANTLDSAVRKWQVTQAEKLGLENLPLLNKETQYSKMLADALGKKLAGSNANNAVSLTDWIILAGGDPTAIAGFIGKKIISSKGLQSKVAETLSKGKQKIDVKAKFGKGKTGYSEFIKKYDK